jgi:hypothetical protein
MLQRRKEGSKQEGILLNVKKKNIRTHLSNK